MTQTATSPQRKPLLDQASFQQLLQAAYVLQEHNDRLRAKGVQADFAENLSAIVETQKLIQTLQLDLTAAAELVAERVQKITNASGAAIGIIDKGGLVYRAATGLAAVDAATRIAPDSALSADCLSKGSALSYPDVTPRRHVNSELFSKLKVKAFIAVPVYHAGQVAGVLELRFARANAFREADLRSAELMAGLLSEAMVTAARMKWKEALASERQSMLEALERIKPQLERLGSDSQASTVAPLPSASLQGAKAEPGGGRLANTCVACGSDFFDAHESFCGICGTARPLMPSHNAQRDSASSSTSFRTDLPWLTPYEQENPANGNSGGILPHGADPLARESTSPASFESVILPEPPAPSPSASRDTAVHAIAETMPEVETLPLWNPLPAPVDPLTSAPDQFPAPIPGSDVLRIVPAEPQPAEMVLADPIPNPSADKLQPYPWDSAKKAQHWLETVKSHRGPRTEWLAQQWQRRRANIYLVIAVAILLLAITGWGIRPAAKSTAGNATPAAVAPRQTPAAPELTLFEKLMVNLGLAEPPAPPVNMGNPTAQVWVDVHTALYYCANSDLFGKTADGRFATQKDAQQDQFEPANRKPCP